MKYFRIARNALAAHDLKSLRETARDSKNMPAALVEAAKTQSLGQIIHALHEAGGEYRRIM